MIFTAASMVTAPSTLTADQKAELTVIADGLRELTGSDELFPIAVPVHYAYAPALLGHVTFML